MSSWQEKRILKTIKLCTQEILLHEKKACLARYRLSEAMSEYQVLFQKKIADGEQAVMNATIANSVAAKAKPKGKSGMPKTKAGSKTKTKTHGTKFSS